MRKLCKEFDEGKRTGLLKMGNLFRIEVENSKFVELDCNSETSKIKSKKSRLKDSNDRHINKVMKPTEVQTQFSSKSKLYSLLTATGTQSLHKTLDRTNNEWIINQEKRISPRGVQGENTSGDLNTLGLNLLEMKFPFESQQSSSSDLAELMETESQIGNIDLNSLCFSLPQSKQNCSSTCSSNSPDSSRSVTAPATPTTDPRCITPCSDVSISTESVSDDDNSAIVNYILELQGKADCRPPNSVESVSSHSSQGSCNQHVGGKTVEECLQYLLDIPEENSLADRTNDSVGFNQSNAYCEQSIDSTQGNVTIVRNNDVISNGSDVNSNGNNTESKNLPCNVYGANSDVSMEVDSINPNVCTPTENITDVVVGLLKVDKREKKPCLSRSISAIECIPKDTIYCTKRSNSSSDSTSTQEKCPFLTFILTNEDV